MQYFARIDLKPKKRIITPHEKNTRFVCAHSVFSTSAYFPAFIVLNTLINMAKYCTLFYECAINCHGLIV